MPPSAVPHLSFALGSLPSLPRHVSLVLDELNAREPELRTIAGLLQEDPVLTVRLLAIANSARFRLSRAVSTVEEALPLLGLDELRALVCAAAIAGAFRQVGGIRMEQFWRYSLNVAKLTQVLARSTPWAASASTAGLLHAVGELVLHRSLPQAMAELDAVVPVFDLQRANAQRERLGCSYAEVGAEFARHWRLPEPLALALERHASPDTLSVDEPLAGYVHVAVWRARMELRSQGIEALVAHFPEQVTRRLNIDSRVVLDEQAIEWTSWEEAGALL